METGTSETGTSLRRQLVDELHLWAADLGCRRGTHDLANASER